MGGWFAFTFGYWGKKDITFIRFGSVLERFSLVKILSFLLSTYEIWKVLVSLAFFFQLQIFTF
jgi:hypothetical protein